MKAFLRATLLVGIAASAQAQKRDTIRVKVGDTSIVGFSLSDTTTVKPIKNGFIAKACGTSYLFKRAYADSSRHTQRSGGDTSVVIVSGCTAPPIVVPPVVIPPPIPVTFDTTAKAAILALVGPVISIASEPASIAFYEQKFTAYADTQWTAFGAKWDAGNSISAYERPATFYTAWALTGDTVWRSRAHQLIVDWRDKYLIPANYAASPHWSQMESLLADCRVTHDAASCDAIPRVAGVLSAFPPSSYFDVSGGEARIQARVLVALWVNEQYTKQPLTLLDSAIVKVLRGMNTSGFTPFAATCGGSLNYMNGMLYDVLTRIHDQRPGPYNAAIESSALAFGTFLKTSQWRGPADPSFNYMSILCTGTGSPTSAPDVNGIMLPVIGWLGKFTKDASWFTLGDQALQGMKGAYLDGYRQFSESYGSSRRYLGYRYSASVIH